MEHLQGNMRLPEGTGKRYDISALEAFITASEQNFEALKAQQGTERERLVLAHVFIDTKPGKAHIVHASLASIPEVLWSAVVAGPHAIHAFVGATTPQRVGEVVIKDIWGIQDVLKTTTCPVIKMSQQ